MRNKFTIRHLSTLMASMLLLVALSVNSQTAQTPAKHLSNTYGIADDVWLDYLNKTNLYLEKVDEMSFINYIFFANDGDFADMNYFTNYVGGKLRKDKAELIYRVGKGTVNSVADVKNYFAALQPTYNGYYLDFLKHKKEIVDTQNSLRAPTGGGTPTPANCGSPCTNPGFEAGTGFWDYYTGSACASSTSDPCSIVSGFSATQHVIQTVGGYDATVGGTILPVVPPGGGSSSLMLGDGPTTGGLAARASISFTVSAANANFTYRYAVVLQDPVSGHTDPERPYFNVHIRDGSGNLISCGEYMVLAKPPIVGFTETSPGSAIWYRNWTTVFVPLNSYIGQCVTVQFTSSDCSQGGHFGYAYIDGDCDPLTLLTSSPSVCGGSSVTLTAPPGGASYAWTNTAGGTTGIVGSTTGQTATVNAGGTYQCLITSVSGASCTTTLTITIGSSPTSPVANFTNTTVCAGLATTFTDISTPGGITGWAWDFNGDGITDSNLQNPTYTFPAAGTYPVTLIVTKGSCNDAITLTVTVNSGSPPTITPAGPFCASAASVTLAGSPAGGTWSGTGITNSATGVFDPAVATVGNNTITYTTSGACGGTVNATIVVNANPVTTVNSPTICPTTSATLTGAGATSYSWSTGAVTNPITVSPAATTSYTVTGTTSGCTSTAVSTVTLAGALSPTVNSPTVCAGVTATLTATGGTTYTWDTGATINPLSVTPATTTSYTVTANTGGCTGTAVATVTVNPLPVLVITNPAPICLPGTIDITAAAVTAGSTGSGVLSYWSDAAATIALGSPTAISTSGTYYIESTTASGCTDIAPVVATINPLPVSNAGADISFCSGGSGNLGVATTAGETYSWSATTGLSSSTVSNPSVTITIVSPVPVTSIYTVTTTITSSGCTSTDAVNVTVNPVPVLVITNPAAVCSPGTIDITAPAVTAGSTLVGSTLAYWNDAAATSPLGTPAAVTTSGTYYIQANAGGGCSDIAPVVVTINPLPVSDAGPDITICTGGTGNIGAATVAGNNYSWSPSLGLSSSAISNPTVTLINGGVTSTTNPYTVTTTIVATGCTSTDVVNVIVDAVATANAGSAQSVCVGSNITLAGAIGGSATGGTWSGGAGTYAPNNTTLNAVYTPSAAEYAAGTITLTLTTNDPTGPCTFASSNVTFTFYQTPAVAFTVDDPDGCPVHCVVLTDLTTVGGGDNIVGWSWDFGDGVTDNTNNSTPSHCYANTGLYTVTLTTVSNHGCIATLVKPAYINVFPVPVAEFSPTPTTATILDPVVTLNNQSSSDVSSWYYYFGDGDSLSPNVPSPSHTYPNVAANTYTVTLIVQNTFGCWDTIQHDVAIGPEFTFFIPNAFTPNGDGVNDYFFGQGIGIDKYDLFIFDRWGNMIFHGHDLNDMWNGKANGGDDVAQQDVYVWKVKLTDVFGKKHNYIGTVTLVK